MLRTSPIALIALSLVGCASGAVDADLEGDAIRRGSAKADICHWSDDDEQYVLLNVSTRSAHFDASKHADDLLPGAYYTDTDGDGYGDATATATDCPDDLTGWSNDNSDVFPNDPTEHADSDGDGVGDNSDACPGFDDGADADGDTVPDGCDLCDGDDATGDTDGDAVCDDIDACDGDDASGDTDGDLVCDDIDACDGDDASGDTDGDAVCDDIDTCPLDAADDSDGDGLCDSDDACPGEGPLTTDDDGDGCEDNTGGGTAPSTMPTPDCLSYTFTHAADVAVDDAGNIYVADMFGSANLHAFDADGNLRWTKTGNNPYSYKVDVDSAGNVYLGNSGYVSVYDTDGNDVGTLTYSGMSVTEGVAVDSADNVYVADTFRNRIVVFPAGSTTGTPMSTSPYNWPTAIDVDANDELCTVNLSGSYTRHVQTWLSDGTLTGAFYDGSRVIGVACDGNGNIITGNNSNTRVWDTDGNLIGDWAHVSRGLGFAPDGALWSAGGSQVCRFEW